MTTIADLRGYPGGETLRAAAGWVMGTDGHSAACIRADAPPDARDGVPALEALAVVEPALTTTADALTAWCGPPCADCGDSGWIGVACPKCHGTRRRTCVCPDCGDEHTLDCGCDGTSETPCPHPRRLLRIAGFVVDVAVLRRPLPYLRGAVTVAVVMVGNVLQLRDEHDTVGLVVRYVGEATEEWAG